MADPQSALEPLLAALTEDGRSLVRSLRTRAQAAGLAERFEPGRGGRGELCFSLGAREVARLLLKARALPRIAFAQAPGAAAGAIPEQPCEPEQPREIAGLRDAAAAGERLKSAAAALAASAPQLDLFGSR